MNFLYMLCNIHVNQIKEARQVNLIMVCPKRKLIPDLLSLIPT